MPGQCDICGELELKVISTRTVNGRLKHYCEKCIAPIKETEKETEKQRKKELEEKFRKQEELERIERIEQNLMRRQRNMDLLAQQRELNGAATLIDKYREDYEAALGSIDVDVKKLIEDGCEMKGLFLFQENCTKILEIHRVLDGLYNMVYTNKEVLIYYKSKRLDQLGHELIPLRTQALPVVGSEYLEPVVMEGLQGLGFNKKHWCLNPCLINEIEYLLEILPLLIEPDFIPFEQNTDDDATAQNTDRYISKSVKISVWRRDCGKCVECGSQERLEYDHIIPVAKGGSNTERNVQLLCEKCNRQKSANIQ